MGLIQNYEGRPFSKLIPETLTVVGKGSHGAYSLWNFISWPDSWGRLLSLIRNPKRLGGYPAKWPGIGSGIQLPNFWRGYPILKRREIRKLGEKGPGKLERGWGEKNGGRKFGTNCGRGVDTRRKYFFKQPTGGG